MSSAEQEMEIAGGEMRSAARQLPGLIETAWPG